MRLEEIFEESASDKKPVVVFGGRFQPWHRGHYQTYLWLCEKFGKGNVWIATSNKTNYDKSEGPVSPFSFGEKVEIITGLYGIESRRIVECKNPAFKPTEVFGLYRGFSLVYIAACGEKNEDRYKHSNFFLPLPRDARVPRDVGEMLSVDEGKGYYVVVPMKSGGVSATDARDALLNADEKDLKKTFEHYFGRYNEEIADLIVTRLKEMK